MSGHDALEATGKLTGVTPKSAQAIGGAASRVELASGEWVVAKRHDDVGAAWAEAASLIWLAEPDAVSVPRVHGHDETWLVTDFVEPGQPTPPAAEELGRALAKLHAAGAPAFGSAPPDGPEDAWIGLAPMRNEATDDWGTFYACHRIEPYLRDAVDRELFSSGQGELFEKVMQRIDDLAGPSESPARLHGDLWSGNVLWGADGHAWLIDPAAHGGHRETDLAMLRLFGCPHLDRIVGSYQEVAPLADGWRRRVPLHQLFPLLVHTVLFGGGYAAQAVSAAREALGG